MRRLTLTALAATLALSASPAFAYKIFVSNEKGNDITVTGPGFTGDERYRIASFNRTREHFTVLLHTGDATGDDEYQCKIHDVLFFRGYD